MQAFLIVVGFATVVLFAARRYPLYLGLILGAAILYLSGGSLSGFGGMAWDAMREPRTVELALSVALISFLSSLLTTSGIMDQMTSGLNGMIKSPRFNIMAVPALIGGMPMAGGAAMSAPVVQEMGEQLGISRPSLSAINLTFRHVFYLVMPFRPDFMLTAGLSGIDVMQLALYNIPLFLTLTVVGYFRLFRHAGRAPSEPTGIGNGAWLQFLKNGSPILVPIALSMAAGWSLPAALLVGTTIAVALAMKTGHLRRRWKDWMGRVDQTLVLTMIGIMIFRGAATELTALGQWLHALVERGIPIWVTAIIVGGLIAYLSSGMQTALVVVLPMVIPLVNPGSAPAYAMLIYGTCLIFYFASPLHLCQILTNQMMNVRLGEVYREYGPVLVSGFAVLLMMFLILS